MTIGWRETFRVDAVMFYKAYLQQLYVVSKTRHYEYILDVTAKIFYIPGRFLSTTRCLRTVS